MRGERRMYTEAFRREAVGLYRRGERSVKEVSDDLGVNYWTLRDWLNQDEMKRKKLPARPKPQTASETLEEKAARLERELARLERENARLREDREILKKAAAFLQEESE